MLLGSRAEALPRSYFTARDGRWRTFAGLRAVNEGKHVLSRAVATERSHKASVCSGCYGRLLRAHAAALAV